MRTLRRWFWTQFGQRYYTLTLWMALGKDPADFYGSAAEVDDHIERGLSAEDDRSIRHGETDCNWHMEDDAPVCAHCYDDAGGHYDWPCPTAALLDERQPTTTEPSPCSQCGGMDCGCAEKALTGLREKLGRQQT